MFFGVWHDGVRNGAQNDETVVMRLLPRLDRSPVPDWGWHCHWCLDSKPGKREQITFSVDLYVWNSRYYWFGTSPTYREACEHIHEQSRMQTLSLDSETAPGLWCFSESGFDWGFGLRESFASGLCQFGNIWLSSEGILLPTASRPNLILCTYGHLL